MVADLRRACGRVVGGDVAVCRGVDHGHRRTRAADAAAGAVDRGVAVGGAVVNLAAAGDVDAGAAVLRPVACRERIFEKAAGDVEARAAAVAAAVLVGVAGGNAAVHVRGRGIHVYARAGGAPVAGEVVGDDGVREFASARPDEDPAAVCRDRAARDGEAADLGVRIVYVQDAEAVAGFQRPDAAENGAARAVCGAERRGGLDGDRTVQNVVAIRDVDLDAVDVRGAVNGGDEFRDVRDRIMLVEDADIVLSGDGVVRSIRRDGERDGVEAGRRDGEGGLFGGGDVRLAAVPVRELPGVGRAGAVALDGRRKGDGRAGEEDGRRGGEGDGALRLVVLIAADIRRGAFALACVTGKVERAEAVESCAAVAERRGSLEREVAARGVGEGRVLHGLKRADGLREGAVGEAVVVGRAIRRNVGCADRGVLRRRVCIGSGVADGYGRAIAADAAAHASGGRVAVDGAVVHLAAAGDIDPGAVVLRPVVRGEGILEKSAADKEARAAAGRTVVLVGVAGGNAAIDVRGGGVHVDARASSAPAAGEVVGDDAVRDLAAEDVDVHATAVRRDRATGDREAGDLCAGVVHVDDAETVAGFKGADAPQGGVRRAANGMERHRAGHGELVREHVVTVRDEDFRPGLEAGVGDGRVDVRRCRGGGAEGRARTGGSRINVDCARTDVEIGLAFGGKRLSARDCDVEPHRVEARGGKDGTALAGRRQDGGDALLVRDRPGTYRVVSDADERGREDDRVPREDAFRRNG